MTKVTTSGTSSMSTRPSDPSTVKTEAGTKRQGCVLQLVRVSGCSGQIVRRLSLFCLWLLAGAVVLALNVFVTMSGIHCLPPRSRFFSGQKDADTNGSSDSDTNSGFRENSKRPARLTPATMVDRSAGGAMRRPPAKSPPPPFNATQETAPRDLEKEERERGNAKFVRGDFEGAVKCYTR